MNPSTRFRPTLETYESREFLSTLTPPLAHSHVDAFAHADGEYNTGRYPAERRDLSPSEFPRLGRNYEVIAPFSGRYNCIAHSLGIHDRWISPHLGPARSPLRWADATYGKAGYSRLPTLDMGLEPGERKVVVYGTINKKGAITSVLHAALQRPDGTWTSKMGDGGLIDHPTPASVAGGIYGRPIAVYVEPV